MSTEILITVRHFLWWIIALLLLAIIHYDLPKVGAWFDKEPVSIESEKAKKEAEKKLWYGSERLGK